MKLTDINDQINEIQKQQAEELLKTMADQNAKIEALRLENEKRIAANTQKYKEAEQKHINAKIAEKEQYEAVQRAERDARIAEEQKLNVIEEAKAKEKAEAEALKKRLSDLQFAHEQALRALKDSYTMSTSQEVQLIADEDQAPKDGSVKKDVVQNTEGQVNPLKKFCQPV